MTKYIFFTFLGLLLCSSKCKKAIEDTATVYNQNGVIHKQMVGRASWQWIILLGQDTVMTKKLPKALEIDKINAALKFNFTGLTDTLYQAGPVDLPEFYGAYPDINIQEFKIIENGEE